MSTLVQTLLFVPLLPFYFLSLFASFVFFSLGLPVVFFYSLICASVCFAQTCVSRAYNTALEVVGALWNALKSRCNDSTDFISNAVNDTLIIKFATGIYNQLINLILSKDSNQMDEFAHVLASLDDEGFAIADSMGDDDEFANVLDSMADIEEMDSPEIQQDLLSLMMETNWNEMSKSEIELSFLSSTRPSHLNDTLPSIRSTAGYSSAHSTADYPVTHSGVSRPVRPVAHPSIHSNYAHPSIHLTAEYSSIYSNVAHPSTHSNVINPSILSSVQDQSFYTASFIEGTDPNGSLNDLADFAISPGESASQAGSNDWDLQETHQGLYQDSRAGQDQNLYQDTCANQVNADQSLYQDTRANQVNINLSLYQDTRANQVDAARSLYFLKRAVDV